MIPATDEMRLAIYRAARQWAAEHSHPQPDDRMLDAAATALLAIVERDHLRPARSLLSELVDPDDCWTDHNGLCQAHSLDPAPCPHARAKAALAATPEVA